MTGNQRRVHEEVEIVRKRLNHEDEAAQLKAAIEAQGLAVGENTLSGGATAKTRGATVLDREYQDIMRTEERLIK